MLFHIFTLITAVAAQLPVIVPTLQGNVIGSLASESSGTVLQFLGVPYASAKRWEAPQDPSNRTTAINATDYGGTCPQLLTKFWLEFLQLVGVNETQAAVPESEDCLTVNIWAPSPERKQNKTAVMIWLYGGGFQFGTSNFYAYDGQQIVRDNDDVLVVTVNYRTNIFGQPGAPQLSSTTQSQNFGLLDVEAAIKWVHLNIAFFGGDPERIILFGQSAGGSAADLYSYMRPDDKIVKGIIVQSGGGDITGPRMTDPTAWNKVADAVHCGTTNDAAQLSCMRGKSYRELEDAAISSGASFALTVDDITVFSDFKARADAGKFLRVPLLVGSTQNEDDIFIVAAQRSVLPFSVPVVSQVASDIATASSFTCPASERAGIRLKANVATWRYQYQAVFSDISAGDSNLRAYHTSEIPLIFGTYKLIPLPHSDAEMNLSMYMQRAWVAFARDPAQGLSKYGWPEYKSSDSTLALLGNQANQSGPTFSQKGLIDLSCGT